MKKKLIIIWCILLISFIIINILYGFFFEDNINNINDKLLFRKMYYSRRILENSAENIVKTENMTVSLINSTYDKASGNLNLQFAFNLSNNRSIREMTSILRIHDNTNMFYNRKIGKDLYVDNIDYLLYNNNLYFKLSNKNFNINTMEIDKRFFFSQNNGNTKLNVELNLEKNYDISNYLYVTFLDIIYKPDYNSIYKVFDELGEIQFKINPKDLN